MSFQACQERLSDLIGPYWGTYGIVYRVTQPVLECKRNRSVPGSLGTVEAACFTWIAPEMRTRARKRGGAMCFGSLSFRGGEKDPKPWPDGARWPRNATNSLVCGKWTPIVLRTTQLVSSLKLSPSVSRASWLAGPAPRSEPGGAPGDVDGRGGARVWCVLRRSWDTTGCSPPREQLHPSRTATSTAPHRPRPSGPASPSDEGLMQHHRPLGPRVEPESVGRQRPVPVGGGIFPPPKTLSGRTDHYRSIGLDPPGQLPGRVFPPWELRRNATPGRVSRLRHSDLVTHGPSIPSPGPSGGD